MSAEARRALETHLVTCPDCLRAFVAIERDPETAAVMHLSTGDASPPHAFEDSADIRR